MLIKCIVYITSDFKTDSWSLGIGDTFTLLVYYQCHIYKYQKLAPI